MKSLRTHFGGLGNRLFQLAYLYAQARKGEIPDIYIQDTKYFEPYQDEIRALYGEGLEPVDMVSLHVRRGDYLNNPFYVNLNETDYYDRALAMFPGEKFLVFCSDRQPGSDDESDQKWCEERFPGKDFRFFRGETEVDDLNAMASCKAHIGANSSFSWWAAFISGNQAVFPKQWFSDGKQRVSLSDKWTLI